MADFRIATVSRLTGLPADTIRAWERRYGLVQPARDLSGIRQYTEEETARLTLARQATALGHPIRHVATMSDEQLRGLIETAAGAGAKNGSFLGGSTDSIVRSVTGAIRRYDPERAERWLDAAAALLSPESFILDVLAPLMRTVGEYWEKGELSIAQEHLISSLVATIVANLKRRMIRRDDRGSLLFATPPGDAHAFGIEMAACLAIVRGWNVCTLGSNVPAAEVLRTARQLMPRTVVIGSIMPSSRDALDAYVECLDVELPAPTQLWVGGPGMSPAAPARWSPRVSHVATLEQFLSKL